MMYFIYIAGIQKRKRPILCYSEFRAKALVRQTITVNLSIVPHETQSNKESVFFFSVFLLSTLCTLCIEHYMLVKTAPSM